MYKYYTNRQGLVPLGNGSLYSKISQISSTTRDRAVKANLVEIAKTERLKSIFDQQLKENEILTAKIIQRTSKSLKEKSALHHVLKNDFSVPCFKTLQHGFNRKDVFTPNTSRHVKAETKLYHVGFDKSIFKADVYRRLRQTDPRRRKENEIKYLLNKSRRQSQVLIDRKLSNSAFDRLLRDPRNLQQYMYQRKPTKLRFQEEEPNLSEATDKPETERITNAEKF